MRPTSDRPSSNRKTLAASRARAALAGLALGLGLGEVAAGPLGENVVGGDGQVSRPDAGLTVIDQRSQRLAIEWDSFDVGGAESVRFEQPSADAAALNRILDQDPSQIFGQIQANGRVFLANPNGIVFGESARVDVGALIAAGMDVDPQRFMAGEQALVAVPGTGGVVINRGLLRAATGGAIGLAGREVLNEGYIAADYGRVELGAGERVLVDFDGDGLLAIEADPALLEDAVTGTAAVANRGHLRAEGGTVVLRAETAASVFDRAINNEGLIEAGRIDDTGGVVRLVGVGGVVEHSGVIDVAGRDAVSTGGSVQVLGEAVGLTGSASIDASGPTGGGEVLVGGDYQGANPEVPNARVTYMGEAAEIHADAGTAGDGGRVILWADGATRFFGTIGADAGAHAGDGGFVETSGKEHLTAFGTVSTHSPHGAGGEWLIDPTDITIVSGNMDEDIGGSPVFVPTADATTPGNGSELSVGSLNTALNTSNVTVTTGFANGQAGSVTWNANMDYTLGGADRTLTIDAAGDIAVGARIRPDNSETNALSITLNAGSTQAGNPATATDGNVLTDGAINVTNNVTTQGGALVLNATNGVTVSGALSADGTDASLTNPGNPGGNVTITASGGNVSITGNITAEGGNGSDAFDDTVGQIGGAGGTVTVTATAGTVAADLIRVNGGNAAGFDGNDVATGGAAGEIVITAGNGTFTLNDQLAARGGNGVNGGAAGAGGDVGISATGNLIETNGGPDIVAAGLVIAAAGVGTGIGTDDQLEIDVDTLALDIEAGGADLTNDGTLVIGAVTAGTISETGIDSGGALDITTTAGGNLTLTNATNAAANSVTFDAAGAIVGTALVTGGDVTLTAGNGSIGTTGGAGDVQLAASGTLTANASANAADSVYLASAGALEVDAVTAGTDGTIDVSAAAITEAGAGDAAVDVSANSVVLTANAGAGNIGAAGGAGALEIALTGAGAALTATANGAAADSVYLSSAGTLTLEAVTAGANGTVSLAASAIVEAGVGDAGVDIAGATLILDATAGAGDIGAAAGAGALEITAGTSLTATATGAAADSIYLVSAGALALDSVNAGAAGTVDLTATAITEAGAGDAGVDVAGDTVDLTATAGNIGAAAGAGALEITATGTLSADASTNAADSVYLTSAAALAIGAVTAGTAGTVDLTAAAITEAGVGDAGIDIAGSTVGLTATTGSIGAAAGAGALEITATGALTATANTNAADSVYLTSTGALAIDSVAAGATGTVDLTATAITEAGAGDAGVDVAGDTVVLAATAGAGNIGAAAGAGALEITATGTLTATANSDAADSVYLQSAGALAIGSVTAGANGTVDITAAAITDAGAENIVVDIAGDAVVLRSTTAIVGAAGVLDTRGALETDAGTLDVRTTGTGGDHRIVIVESDDATLTDVQTAEDAITVVSNTGTLTVNTVQAGTTTPSAVTLSALLGAIEGPGTVTATAVDLDARTNIGTAGTALALAATTISADSANGGVVNLANTLGGGNTVTVTSLNAGGTANDVTFVQSGGAALDLPGINARNVTVTVNDNDLTVTAGNNVTANGTGNVVLTASGTGNVTVGGGAAVNAAGSGDVSLLATGTGNVVLTGTTSAAGDRVTIDSTGGAVNGAGLVTADTVDLDAATGIGGTTPLELRAATISADSDAGNVDLDNDLAGAVAVGSLNTVGGSVRFDQSGGGAATFNAVGADAVTLNVTDADLIVGGGIVANNAGDVALATVNAGDIRLNDTVTATDDNVSLNAAGAINGAGLVTASVVDLDATAGIGNATPLSLAAATITADGAGNIDIDNALGAGTVNVNSLAAGAANTVTFDQSDGASAAFTGVVGSTVDLQVVGGNLTLDGAINTAGNVGLAATGNLIDNVAGTTVTAAGLVIEAAGVGAGTAQDDELETAVSTLALDVEAGGADIRNAGTLTVGAVTAGGVSETGIDSLGDVAIDTGAGNIVLTNAITAAGRTVTLNSAGTIGGAGTVTATTVDLDANTAIAADLAATSISADSAAGGVINLTNNLAAGTVTVASLSAGLASDVVFQQSGGAGVSFPSISANNVTLTVNDGSSLTVATGNSVTANGAGNVVLTADGGGNVVVDTGAAVNAAGTGNTTLRTTGAGTGNVVLSGTTRADANLVTIRSAGGNINGAGLVTAATVDLDAASGIGASAALELAAGSIFADSAAGAIDIDNTLATPTSVNTLNTVGANVRFDQAGGGAATFSQVTGDGVTLSVTGAGLTVAGTGIVASNAGDVALSTLTSGNVVFTSTTTAAGAQVTVNSAGTINGTPLITAAAVDLDAAAGIGTTGTMQLAASALSADTTAGAVALDNTLAGAVAVTSLTTAATDAVTFSQNGGGGATFTTASGGAVSLAVNDGGNLTVAGAVTANGAGNDLLLDTVGGGNIVVDGTATATGRAVSIDSSGTLGGSGTLVADAITLNTAGAIGASGSALQLSANSPGTPIALSAITTTNDTDIYLASGSDIALGTIRSAVLGAAIADRGTVSLSGGSFTDNVGGTDIRAETISLTAAGSIGVASTPAVNGAVDVEASTVSAAAAGDVFLYGITQAIGLNVDSVTSTTGAVTLISAGAIGEAGAGDGAADVSAGTVSLTANNGAISDVEITADTFSASATGGSIGTLASALALTPVTTGGTITLASVTAASANQDIYLASTADLGIGLVSGLNQVSLSGAAIVDADASANTATDVSGFGVTLQSSSNANAVGIGTGAARDNALDVVANTSPAGGISASTQGADIYIQNGADLRIRDLNTASSGDVSLRTNTGTVTFANDISNLGGLTLDLGSGAVNLPTAVNAGNSLTILSDREIGLGSTTTGFNMTLAELDSITAGTLRLETTAIAGIMVAGLSTDNTEFIGTLQLVSPGQIEFASTNVVNGSLGVSAGQTFEFSGIASVTVNGQLSLVGTGALLIRSDTTLTTGGFDFTGVSINGVAGASSVLSLNAGANAITLGEVGQGTPISGLRISGASTTNVLGNISTLAGGIDLSGSTDIDLTGDITLSAQNGPIRLTTSGGNAIDASGALSVVNTGTTTIGSITSEGAMNFSGATRLDLSGAVQLRANNGSAISFANGGSVLGDTAGDALTLVTSGTTTLAGTVTTDGAINLANASTVALDGAVVLQANNGNALTFANGGTVTGGTVNDSLTLVSSGTTTLGGTVTANGGIDLSGAPTIAGGALTLVSSGATTLGGTLANSSFDLSRAANVVLAADVSLGDEANGIQTGDVLLTGGSVTGANDLTIFSGNNVVTLGGTLGGPTATRLGSLTVSNAGTTRLTDATVRVQNSGGAAGDAEFSSIDFSNARLVEVTGTNLLDSTFPGADVSLNGAQGLTGTGSLEVRTNDGDTLLSTVGALSQLSIGGRVGSLTGGVDLDRVGALALHSDTSIDTSALGGAVVLTPDGLTGPGALSINSGAGNVTIGAANTATSALGAVSITTSGVLANTGDLFSSGSITATAGSVTMTSEPVATVRGSAIDYTATTGDMLLGQLNAGTGNVNLTATLGSLLSNTGGRAAIITTQPHIIAANTTLSAGNQIGASSDRPVAMDISRSGLITLTFGAPEAFINNINGTTVRNLSGNVVIDIFTDRAIAANRGQSAGLEVLHTGVTPPAGGSGDAGDLLQVEGADLGFATAQRRGRRGDLVITSRIPDVPALVRTRDGLGWEFRRARADAPALEEPQTPARRPAQQRDGEQTIEWLREGFKYQTPEGEQRRRR